MKFKVPIGIGSAYNILKKSVKIIGRENMTDIQLQSTITCPRCHQKTIEQMPTDYCLYIWVCPNCKNKLKPKEGDCCVYCSYVSVRRPPIQKGSRC